MRDPGSGMKISSVLKDLNCFYYVFIVNKCFIEALILLRIFNTQSGFKKRCLNVVTFKQ